MTRARTVPGGRKRAPPDRPETVLRLLALAGDGRLEADRRQAADVRVVGEGDRATVSLADREFEVEVDDAVDGDRDREYGRERRPREVAA